MAGISITNSIYHSVIDVGLKVLTNVGVTRTVGKTRSGKIDCTKTRIPEDIKNAIHDLTIVDLAFGMISFRIRQKALEDLYNNIIHQIQKTKKTPGSAIARTTKRTFDNCSDTAAKAKKNINAP